MGATPQSSLNFIDWNARGPFTPRPILARPADAVCAVMHSRNEPRTASAPHPDQRRTRSLPRDGWRKGPSPAAGRLPHVQKRTDKHGRDRRRWTGTKQAHRFSSSTQAFDQTDCGELRIEALLVRSGLIDAEMTRTGTCAALPITVCGERATWKSVNEPSAHSQFSI